MSDHSKQTGFYRLLVAIETDFAISAAAMRDAGIDF